MGTFDEEEYERRERQISSVDADSDDRRTNFEGRVEYVDGDSVDDLLSRFEELKAKRPENRSPSRSKRRTG